MTVAERIVEELANGGDLSSWSSGSSVLERSTKRTVDRILEELKMYDEEDAKSYLDLLLEEIKVMREGMGA